MDPEMINCMILHIHVENKIILSHAILRRTSVSARSMGVKKNSATQTNVSIEQKSARASKDRYRATLACSKTKKKISDIIQHFRFNIGKN